MDAQNDSAMSYGHMPLPERRDDGTPFQNHQGLGQALGTHLPPRAPYQDSAYRISPSPSALHARNAGPSQSHPGSAPAHSPLTYSVPVPAPAPTSPAIKRKHADGLAHISKRRRDADAADDAFDADAAGQGAKHWTDEEKSKLFNWLMGPGQDDHWNSLRATKNSCLRECAVDVFGSKKTYQALKGCYERNFNLFKQIYAFESYHANAGSGVITALSETDRLREYERRLQTARKAGCDVGSVNARTIEHWHRIGWYDLFYRRWHGDPATTRPVVPRNAGAGAPNSAAGDDAGDEDDAPLDYADGALPALNGLNGLAHDRAQSVSFINPQALRDGGLPPPQQQQQHPPPQSQSQAPPPPPPPQPQPQSLAPPLAAATGFALPAGAGAGGEITFSVSQQMLNAYLQFLQMQTQTSKAKLEYLRRREEREERDSAARREVERVRMEREAAEFEHTKQVTRSRAKADRAVEVLDNPRVEASVRQAAGDYLKKMFASD